MHSFSRALREVYSSLKGKAELSSDPPGEFSLSISPSSPRGYVLVRVEVSQLTMFKCSMSGEFEIDLPSLAPLVAWSQNPRVNT